MSPVASPPGILIRPPRPAEWPACRLLIPGCFRAGGDPELLIAVSESPFLIVGALGWRRAGDTIYTVRLRVVRTHRRRGIGSALLQELIASAKLQGQTPLLGPADPGADPEAEAFLTPLGFRRLERLTTVVAPIAETHVRFKALRDRFEARGKVPPEVRFVFLPDASNDDIARFYATYIAHRAEMPVPAIRRAMESGTLDDSVILLAGGRVHGILLWELKGDLAIVHARAVSSQYQKASGWANAMLMALALDRGASRGAVRVQFDLPEGNRDTTKLVARFHATATKTRDRYILKLDHD